MNKFKGILILTLLVFAGAGFSFLDDFDCLKSSYSKIEAARKSRKNNKKNEKSNTSSQKKEEKSAKKDSDSFLPDNDNAKSYMPDIYRCPDCGYEQDEAGFCPDHVTLELVKIISNPKDPMAPNELDGNEDILVDVPLNIVFKKDDLEAKKTEEKPSEEPKNKSSKNNKKSK